MAVVMQWSRLIRSYDEMGNPSFTSIKGVQKNTSTPPFVYGN